MKFRTTPFSMADGIFSDGEEQLVKFFLQHLARVYRIDLSETEFLFEPISSGLSSSAKIIAQSEQIYPYFLKIGENFIINKEVSKYNLASSNLPPLYLAPIETVISSDSKKYLTSKTKGLSLVAFKYITGGIKGAKPDTLFKSFEKIDKYKMIELIDEIFQIVFQDLHSFHSKSYMSEFKHLIHKEHVFDELNNATVSSMVHRYNMLADQAPQYELPHGIVHGDLHCENIIVNSKFTPIIIDFEMLRKSGCLLNDYAEFEIALLVAALDCDVDKYGPCARSCYNSINILELFGIDKFSRCVRSIRSNLCNPIFNNARFKDKNIKIDQVSHTYACLLLRYLCSYAWVSIKTMEERRSLIVVGVLSQIFDQLYYQLKFE